MIILVGFVILLGLVEPKRIPFLFKSAALFVCLRSFFIILTHFAPPINESVVNSSNFLERLLAGSGYDLFFSGHTGFSFLMALLFWENKYLRIIFLSASLIFGAAVLFGHLHYSIDVFSAFFITYGIFNLSKWLFKKDHQLFADTVKAG